MRTYEVTFAERRPPARREGMRFKATIRRRSRRHVVTTFHRDYIILAIRCVRSSESLWCHAVGPRRAVCDRDANHGGLHRGWNSVGRVVWSDS